MTVLVLGGTGKTGRRVAARLAARGHRVRVGARSAAPSFDWTDRATWGPELEGVDAAYIAYSPDAGFPGAAEAVGGWARRAVAAGVRRLVLLTGRGEAGAVRTEEAVRATGADLTVLRAAFFAQNFSEDFLVDMVRGGRVVFCADPGVGEPFVDAEDIAEVAVAALTGPEHIGRTYDVTGPRLLGFGAAVAEVAAAAGREVGYTPVPVGAFRDGMVADGVPAGFADPFTALLGEVLDGRNAHVGDGVRRVLGREPRDFAAYAAAAAADGVWDV
ncbi:Rossmann-fold NAD(P)-binding domain-containing protein [Nocardiopsis trehalosi]|uniref:NAD(P)H-binding protein n=1 Tax=Nocardiopsis trehalosi TaxID=109329 RepID=UPI00082A3734|nr:NAD(P)H-binding protein [Nocardiopsis trehalosi]